MLEHFQWKNPEEVATYAKKQKDAIAEELADVLKYLLIMCHDVDIDIEKATIEKMKQDNEKYPVAKARGKHTKYTEL